MLQQLQDLQQATDMYPKKEESPGWGVEAHGAAGAADADVDMLLIKQEMLLSSEQYLQSSQVPCIAPAARMASMQCEAPLEELAARYDDESEEEAGPGVYGQRQQGAVPPAAPPAEAAAAGGAAPADGAAALIAAATAGQEEDEEWGEEEDEEGDWDSGDEELASAMEWADLREGEHHRAWGGRAASWEIATALAMLPR